jgi:8-oxo-dGTP pyrophosphatase MutT (NUDIX family)
MNNLTIECIRTALASDAKRKTLNIPNYARAAVLVPVVSANNSFDLLFTRRTHTVETHKGQVSFPGGMADESDHDVVHTALREAEEEIGLPQSAVKVVGTLDDLATPTRFVITPVVGIIEELPQLRPNPDEVEEVFFVPLAFFLDERNGRTEMREINGSHYEVWFYDYDGKTIWGVTAVIVRALCDKLLTR